ncbi:hypothetical protein GCM10023178_11830 [Actinomadura luteofluorescens]
MRFLARLHAQCELHGYVEGPNRAWLADVIDQGPAAGVPAPHSPLPARLRQPRYYLDALRQQGRQVEGRDTEPSAGIIYSHRGRRRRLRESRLCERGDR